MHLQKLRVIYCCVIFCHFSHCEGRTLLHKGMVQARDRIITA
jgi:hypothetical protein